MTMMYSTKCDIIDKLFEFGFAIFLHYKDGKQADAGRAAW